ncbi:MAG: carboxypeptidase-like regulatory domain-containing protein [Planctomycetota bacterium]
MRVPRIPGPPLRRGGARLLVLVLLVAVGIGAWWLRRTPEHTPAPGLGPEAAPTVPSDLSPQAPDPEDPDALAPTTRVEAGPLPYREMQRDFDGTGELSGEVMAMAGSAMPASWRLEIRPSRFATGSENAVSRDLEFEGNQVTFEVRDLPLAAYTVQAVADGQASMAYEVSLFKLVDGAPGAGKTRSHVMLQLMPLCTLDVQVMDHEGLPAADVPLVAEALGTQNRHEGRTDATGRARWDQLPPGLYRVSCGDPLRPLVASEAITVGQRTQAQWQATLPETFALEILVIDGQENPMPGAHVYGHGPVPIEGESDFAGRLSLQYLPAGTYQVRANHEVSATSGRLTIEVPATSGPEPGTSRLILKP